MNKIFLIEDHDEALKIWRQKKVKNLDLVHLDAHIDFGFQPAKPVEKILNEAKSLNELKKGLEQSIAFRRYEDDFSKQTNIGNYIYPAIEEGIIRDFYWVIPGALKDFKESAKFIKSILKNITRTRSQRIEIRQEKGKISTTVFGRTFIVCTLEKLPILRQKILLDIDTDFLIVDSLKNAGNTSMIGKRKPWILPSQLVDILKKKIKNHDVITIAYSVNGGYTPMIYKHLGDEIAYHFAAGKFKNRLKNNLQAAEYFKMFASAEKKEYYHKATKLNPCYRVVDNNYGPLYLHLRKFSLARDEFLKILRCDPRNPGCLWGLGSIALEKKDFRKAKRYFYPVLKLKSNKLFTKVRNQSLLGLAKAEFNLKNFEKARELLFHYKTLEPLQSQSYYLLGRIFEKERKFHQATNFYKDATRLGFGGIEPILRLLKISFYLKEKDDIIKYLKTKIKKWRNIKERAVLEQKINEAITYGALDKLKAT